MRNNNRIIDTISISELNKGKAGQIINDVKLHGAKIVVKNNHPECVLLSIKEYNKLMDDLEDLRLTVIAAERLLSHKPGDKTYTLEEVEKIFGITQKDLDNAEDDEIE